MDCSLCSTGLCEVSRIVLWLPSPDDVILAGSEVLNMDGTIKNIKIVAVTILCNVYAQLN